MNEANVVQQKATFLEPITENKVNFRVAGNSVIFRNKGTSEVEIDHSSTIAPGETLSLNTDNPYCILVQNITVTFGAGINRLEVIVIATAGIKELDNYVEKSFV